MVNAKELKKVPPISEEGFWGDVISLRDCKEAIAAALLFLIGMGISVGGCALHVRDEIQKRKANREVVPEKKILPQPVNQNKFLMLRGGAEK